MPTIKQVRGESEPNRVLDVQVDTLVADLLLGVVTIQTDFGPIRLAVNRAAAEMLRDEMERFLEGAG